MLNANANAYASSSQTPTSYITHSKQKPNDAIKIDETPEAKN